MEEKRRGSTKKGKLKKTKNQAVILSYPAAWSENTDVGWRPFTENQDPGKKNKSASYSYKNHSYFILIKGHKALKHASDVPRSGVSLTLWIFCYFLTPFQSPHRCALLGRNAPPPTTEFQVLRAHVTHRTTDQSQLRTPRSTSFRGRD